MKDFLSCVICCYQSRSFPAEVATITTKTMHLAFIIFIFTTIKIINMQAAQGLYTNNNLTGKLQHNCNFYVPPGTKKLLKSP